jgi:hypothetical protein
MGDGPACYGSHDTRSSLGHELPKLAGCAAVSFRA